MSHALTEPAWEKPERLEIFARVYVETGSATTAIQKSGLQNLTYGRMSIWAEHLLARPDVQAMIAAVEQSESTRRLKSKEYTRDSIADDFQEIYERALISEEFSPAVAAKSKQAELLGMMEKHVSVTFHGKVTELPMEALEAELARLTDDGVITLDAGDYAVIEGD